MTLYGKCNRFPSSRVWVVKLIPLAVESHTVSEGLPGSIVKGTSPEIFKQLVGQCTATVVKMGGVEIHFD